MRCFYGIVIFLVCFSACKVENFDSGSYPISHDKWTSILQEYVDAEGWFDYKSLSERPLKFNEYLDLLSRNHPNTKNWSDDERLAYWINAYNAYTVKLVIDHYPIQSIKDIKKGIAFINSVWDIDFIEIEGREYSLTNIEHGILRKKFNEPRIHFAINCASYSCPPILNKAFTPKAIEEQLASVTRNFLADEKRNIISSDHIQISKIFSWFGGDFKKESTLIEFLNLYAPVKIGANAKIDHLDYNWTLNDVSH